MGVKAGAVAHQIMHALGFGHGQERKDRDKHITPNFRNPFFNYASFFRDQFIVSEKMHFDTTTFTPYDENSLLHFPFEVDLTGSSEDGDTGFNSGVSLVENSILVKSKTGKKQNVNKFSPLDIKRINHFYP